MSEKEFEADDLEQKDYSYNPKFINVNGIEVTDYTDIEHNRIFLVNRNNILTKPRPSWIPDMDMVCLERDSFLPVCVRDSDGNYFVQKSVLDIPEEKDASKLTAKEKFTKYRKNTYYKMTLDLLAATVDYYIKLKRAELKSKNDTHRVGLPRAMNSMSWERFDGMVSMFNLCEKYKDDEEIKKKYPRNIKKRSPLYDVYTRQTSTAFREHYQPLLSELRDKKLDMNLQKQDAIDTHKKGEDTSYGKTGRSNTLLDKYGFTIKKQNGKSFTSDQIKELDKAAESVWNYFGDLTKLSSEYGLCISVATNTHQHARKAVGLFNSEYNTIGISFFDMTVQDSKEADMVFAHEVTHWLDYKKGEGLHYNYASDKSGTLENEIALKFKNLVRSRNSGSGKPLGEYWYRTCECLARAVEEDYALKHDIHTLDRDMAYVQPEKFIKEIQPLVEKLLNENRLYFSLNGIEPMEQKMNIEKEIEVSKENQILNDIPFFKINEPKLKQFVSSLKKTETEIADAEETKPDTFNYLRGANKSMDNKIYTYQEKIAKLSNRKKVIETRIKIEAKFPLSVTDWDNLERMCIKPVDKEKISLLDKNSFEYYAAVINSSLENTGFSAMKEIPLVIENTSGILFNTLLVNKDGSVELKQADRKFIEKDEYNFIKSRNEENVNKIKSSFNPVIIWDCIRSPFDSTSFHIPFEASLIKEEGGIVTYEYQTLYPPRDSALWNYGAPLDSPVTVQDETKIENVYHNLEEIKKVLKNRTLKDIKGFMGQMVNFQGLDEYKLLSELEKTKAFEELFPVIDLHEVWKEINKDVNFDNPSDSDLVRWVSQYFTQQKKLLDLEKENEKANKYAIITDEKTGEITEISQEDAFNHEKDTGLIGYPGAVRTIENGKYELGYPEFFLIGEGGTYDFEDVLYSTYPSNASGLDKECYRRLGELFKSHFSPFLPYLADGISKYDRGDELGRLLLQLPVIYYEHPEEKKEFHKKIMNVLNSKEVKIPYEQAVLNFEKENKDILDAIIIKDSSQQSLRDFSQHVKNGDYGNTLKHELEENCKACGFPAESIITGVYRDYELNFNGEYIGDGKKPANIRLGEEDMSKNIQKEEIKQQELDFSVLEENTADTITKDSKILDWYKKTYPSDTKMFKDIYPEATFAAFEKAIEEDRYQFNPRYDYGDSVVRERIFQKISELNGEDYSIIYDKWVNLPELHEPHYIRDFDGTLIKFAEPEEQLRLNAEDILYMLQNNYMDSENNEPLLTVEKAREYVMEQIYDYWTDGQGNSSSKDGICSYLRALGNYNELRIIDDAILKTCTNPSYLLPGELQRLKDMDAILKDESIIKVYSYNKIEFWNDRSKAESFYRTAMLATDGSESDRYKNIYADLSSGNMLCCDEHLPYAGYADYVAREECKPSICDYDKDYVLVRQPYSEVVDSLSPENISVSDNNKSKNINKYEASPFYTNRVDLKKSLYEQRRAFLEVKWTERSGLEYLPEGLVWPLCEADVNFRTVNDEFKNCIKAEFTLVYPSEGEEYSDKNRNTYSFGEYLGTGHKLESLSDRIRNMCSYPDKVFPDFEKAFLKEYGTEQMLSKDRIEKINDILLPLKKEYLESLKPLRENLKETEETVRKIKNQAIIDSSSYESAEKSLEESKKAITDLFLSFAAKCVYAEQREVLSDVKQNAYDAALFYANHAVKNVLIDSFSEESRTADYDEIDWNEWHSFVSCLPDITDFDSILNKSHELYRSVINKECRIDFSNVKVLADSPNRRGFEFDINVPEKTALVFGIEEPFTLHGIQKGQNVQMSLPDEITGKYKVNEKEIKAFYDTVNKDSRSLDLSKYIPQQTVEKAQEEIKNEINTAFKETEIEINSSEINQAFVLDGASNGMLSKYIGTGDIERIDEFREFAAKNIEGTASDKSYFAQMWLYGKIFHFDRNIHTEKEFYHYDYPEEKKIIVDEVNEYFKNSNASPKYILCCGGWDTRDGMARPWSYFIGNNRELLIQKARTMISEKAVEFVYLHNTPEWLEDQSKNTLYRIEFNQKLSSGYKLGIISEDDYENKKVTHYKNIKELKDVIRENEKNIPGLSSDAVILKNYGYLSDFNRNVKLVGEKDIKGEPWEKWNTNPEVFLHFYNPKNDKGTVLYIRKDLADIINRHNETSTLEWEDNIAEEIRKLFPEISESYIKTSISPLRMGFRNGSKLNLLVSDTTPEIIQSMITEKEIKNKKTEVNDMSKENPEKPLYEELTPEKFMNFYNDEINENRDVKMDERAAKAVLDSCANEFGLKLSDNKIVSVNDTYPAGQSISASEILRASVIGREEKAAYHLDPKVSVILESRSISGNAKERLFERYHERLKKLFTKQSNNPQFGFSGISNYEEGKSVSEWKGKDNFEEKKQSDKEVSIFSNKDLSDRVSKGKKLIDEYLEEYCGAKDVSQNLIDLYAVGDAKRYVSVNYNGSFYKNLSKEQKKQASEFNKKLEQVLKEYASKRLAEKKDEPEEAKAVSDLYKWARKNHPYCFDRNIASVENYMDTSVIEEYLVKKGIELNDFKKTAVPEQKYTFFVKDTAEFEQFADFEPVTNLTAEEAVKKYSELREKGMSCGIGLHIPGDFIFDDPSGNGITLVVNRDDRAVFDVMGDTFIKELNDRQIKDGSARTYIDAYKELYEAFEKNNVAVKKPQFVFDKESELYSETEHKTSVVISPVKLSDILGVMDMRPDLSDDGKLKVWDIQREEYIDNGNEEYTFESAADIFERLDSYISDYFIDDMVEQLNDAGVGPASAETLEELCRIYKNELEKGNDKLNIDELNLAEGIVNPDTVIIDIKPELSVENKKELTFNYFVRSTSLDSNDKNWFESVRNLTAEEAAKMMIEKFKEGFIPGIGINIPGHPALDDSASSLPVIESNKDGFWDFTEKAHEVIENAGSFAPVLIDAFEELYVGVKKTVDVMSHETDFIENKKSELGIETKWVFTDSALGTDWRGKGYIGPDYDIFTVRQNDKTFVCAGTPENYLNAKGIYDNSDKSFIELCELKPEYGNGLFYRFAYPFGNLNFPVDKLSEEENRVFEDALKEHFPLLWSLYEKHTQQLEDKRETINSSFPVQNGKFFHIIEMIDDIKGFAEGINDHIRTKEDFEKTWNLHVADDAQLIRFGDYLENALYDASLASEKGLAETAALASYAFNLKPEDYKISDSIGFIKSREEAVKKAFGELIPSIADVPVSMNGKYMEFIVERTNNNLLPGGVIRVLNADYADHKLRCTYVDPHNNKLDLSVPENIEILKDWLTSEDLAYYNIWGRKEIASDNHKEKHFIRSLREACENAQTISSVNGEEGISTHKLPDVYRSIGIEEKPLYVPYKIFNSMAESGVDSKDMFNIISGIFDPTLITEFESYARKPCSRHESLCVIPNVLTKDHEPVGIHVVEKEGCLEVEAVSKLSSTYIQDKINNKLLVYYDDCPENDIQNVDFTIPDYLLKPYEAENQESIDNDRFRLKSQNMVFENLQQTLESKDAGLKAIMRNDEGYTSEFYVYGKDESKPLTRGSIYRDGKLWLSDPMSGHLIEHVNNQPNLEAFCKNIADYQNILERKSHAASQSYTKIHDGEKPFTLSVSPDKTKLCLNLEGTPNFAVRERLTECGFSYSTITRQWKAAMNPENLSKFVSTVETLWPDMNDYVKANLAELSVSSETKQREKKCPIDFSKIENTGAKLAENLRTISRDYPEYNGNLTHILSDLFVNAKPQDKQEILAVFKGCSGSDELNVMLKDFAENKNTPKLEKQEEIGPER